MAKAKAKEIDISKLMNADGTKTPLGVLTNRIGMVGGKFNTLEDCAEVSAYRGVSDANPKELFKITDELYKTFKESYTAKWNTVKTGSSGGKTPEEKANALKNLAESFGMKI